MFKKIRSRLLLIGALGFLWWWLRRPKAEGHNPDSKTVEIPIETNEILIASAEQTGSQEILPDLALEKPDQHPPDVRLQPGDDLTTISGIGPKIASVLNSAGITRYAELAAADTAQLWEILSAARIRLAKPETWIEQAKTRLPE